MRERFARFLDEDPSFSAQFCAYLDGRVVLDVWGGPDAEEDTIQGVFSSTKGVAGVCIALLLERGLLDLDTPLSNYWPEFGQAGKESISVRLALSHQAGLPGVEPQLTQEQLIDHDYLAGRLAAQAPHWYPGSGHGYHGLTIGTMMDELVRRIDGRTISQFFRDEIGDPRGVDFFIATPEDQEHRVRDVLPQQLTAEQAAARAASPLRQAGDTLTGMAFNLAVADPTAEIAPNVRSFRASGQASAGGVGSARGLARLYATCISEVDGLPPLLSAPTIQAVSQIHTTGVDLVLGMPTRFAIVFQKPDPSWMRCGSHASFGHDGAGGSMGFADPWHSLAYGYIPRRMSVPGGADQRCMDLTQVLRECLAQGRG